MSHFVFSVGLGVLFCTYVARSSVTQGWRRISSLLFALASVSLFVAQQERANSVHGVVLLDSEAVETVTIEKGAGRIEHHLGAPIRLERVTDSEAEYRLVFGLDAAGTLETVFEPERPRTQIGPWMMEPLGYAYRAGDLSVGLSITNESGQETTVLLKRGQTSMVSETMTIRLVSVNAMGPSEGHRVVVEVIKDGERFHRMLYEQAPSLDETLDTVSPKIRITALRHTPVRRFMLYQSASYGPIWVFLALILLLLVLSATFRERVQ